ncbi:lipase family protein [Tenacibaculum xiamenense]|uniref:lipase family protein n=1 Tax=Tenacibaculum xiamenense TaxID=1261553 RepID=UPI0038960886
MNTIYNNQQRIFTHSVFSNIASGVCADNPKDLQPILAKRLVSLLNNDRVQQLIGTWDVVWGPEVYHSPEEKLNVVTNAMYIAANSDRSQYIIAVSGTNGPSSFGWLTEDFKVENTISWPYSNEEGKDLRISEGTSIGLDILMNQMKSQGQTVSEFLKSDLNHSSQVVVTGHSLGGALSATLALALHDTQNNWNFNRKAIISCLPSAGATPGNKDFSNYYNDALGTQTIRVWNRLDIVPHAWEIGMLQMVPSIYAPYFNSGTILAGIANLAILRSAKGASPISNNPYTQLLPQTPGLNGQINLGLKPPTNLICKIVIDTLLSYLPTTKLPESIVKKIKPVLREVLLDMKPTSVFANIRKRLTNALIKALKGKNDILDYVMNLFNWLWKDISKLANFMLQALYQHVGAYFELYKIDEIYPIMKNITNDNPCTVIDMMVLLEKLLFDMIGSIKNFIPSYLSKNVDQQLETVEQS